MAKIPKRRQAIAKMVEPTRRYNLEEATALVKKCATAKFDETVEIAVRLGGTDPAPLRRHQPVETLECKCQQAFPPNQGKELLGLTCPAHWT